MNFRCFFKTVSDDILWQSILPVGSSDWKLYCWRLELSESLCQSVPDMYFVMLKLFCGIVVAMLPVLENAQQTSLAVKRLEMENCQLNEAVEQHDVNEKRQGTNAFSCLSLIFGVLLYNLMCGVLWRQITFL